MLYLYHAVVMDQKFEQKLASIEQKFISIDEKLDAHDTIVHRVVAPATVVVVVTSVGMIAARYIPLINELWSVFSRFLSK